MKKIFGVAAAFAMVFSVTTAAGAWWHMPAADVEVENEHTSVTTVAEANANTGSVFQMGGHYSKVSTGSVYSVGALAESQVNTTLLPSCSVCRMFGSDVEVENEDTRVTTIAKADVKTGEVKQMSWFGVNKVHTGPVSYVTAGSSANVNYTDFTVDMAD